MLLQKEAALVEAAGRWLLLLLLPLRLLLPRLLLAERRAVHVKPHAPAAALARPCLAASPAHKCSPSALVQGTSIDSKVLDVATSLSMVRKEGMCLPHFFLT